MVTERRTRTADRKPRARPSYLAATHADVLEAAEHVFDDIAVFAGGLVIAKGCVRAVSGRTTAAIWRWASSVRRPVFSWAPVGRQAVLMNHVPIRACVLTGSRRPGRPRKPMSCRRHLSVHGIWSIARCASSRGHWDRAAAPAVQAVMYRDSPAPLTIAPDAPRSAVRA